MANYSSLFKELSALLEGERDYIANAANVSAFVMQNIPTLNWVGFYFLKGHELVLGPFQGKIACTRIPLGRGVCGAAFNQQTTMNVPDVHSFSDHIACDTASESELVLPLSKSSNRIGVFDIDSPVKNRFDLELETFLKSVAELYLSASDF